MADIKFSEFPKATISKDSDEIAILQDGVNKMIPSPVLESKIINKTVTRVIEQGGASLNLINPIGVVPTYADLATITPTPELNDAYQVKADGLVYVYTENGFQADGDGFIVQPEPTGVVEEGNTEAVSGGDVFEAINGITAITPINLSTSSPEQNGIFQPTEVGVYENFGGLELTSEELESNIVYFYYLDGIFTKQSKGVLTVDEVNSEGTNAVNGKAVFGYTNQTINTINDLRLFNGKEGQVITLLGYYEAGDKEPLNYKWTSEQGIDDGGSVINTESGSWEAVFSRDVDVRHFGVYPDDRTSSSYKVKSINIIFKLGFNVVITLNGVYLLSSESEGIELNSMIYPESNTTMKLSPSVTLKLDINSVTNNFIGGVYQIIYCKNIVNFKLYGSGSIIDGDRTGMLNKQATGEWGHGLVISGSKDIEINNIHVVDCWGDGTNISKRNDADNPEYITFNDVNCYNNRRQGLSITAGKIIRVNNSSFLNTNGVSPSAGIDLEPDALDGVIIDDVIFNDIKVNGNTLGIVAYDLQLNTDGISNINVLNSDIEAIAFFSHNPNGAVSGIKDVYIENSRIGYVGSTFTYTLDLTGNVVNLNMNNVDIIGGVRGINIDYSQFILSNNISNLNINNVKIKDFTHTGFFATKGSSLVDAKVFINQLLLESTSYTRALNIQNLNTISATNIDYNGGQLQNSVLSASIVSILAVKGFNNSYGQDTLMKSVGGGRYILISPDGTKTAVISLTNDNRLKIGTNNIIDVTNTADINTFGIVKQSNNVTNITTADATDLATALTLVNELKIKLNAKLTADRNSGQQAT